MSIVESGLWNLLLAPLFEAHSQAVTYWEL